MKQPPSTAILSMMALLIPTLAHAAQSSQMRPIHYGEQVELPVAFESSQELVCIKLEGLKLRLAQSTAPTSPAVDDDCLLAAVFGHEADPVWLSGPRHKVMLTQIGGRQTVVATQVEAGGPVSSGRFHLTVWRNHGAVAIGTVDIQVDQGVVQLSVQQTP